MAIKREKAEKLMEQGGTLLPASFCAVQDGFLSLVERQEGRFLAVVCSDKSEVHNAWKGAEFTVSDEDKKVRWGLFPLNSNNAALVRRLVRWASPTSCGVNGVSVSFSDWLGIVSGKAAALLALKQAKPVLVDFTPENSAAAGRNFLEAMDTAVWSVLSSGYKDGWAANASGLKTEEEIVKALLYGYSGIGIDGSAKIDRSIESLSEEETEKRFGALDREFKEAIDKSYLDAEFKLGSETLRFEEKALHRMVLEFGQAIMFWQKMYKDYLDDTPWDLDFEVDLSGMDRVLTAQEHYFLANELKRAAVKFDTLCVNARQVKNDWEKEMGLHAAIAKAFDYRISFAGAAGAFADLKPLVKACGGRVHFRLTELHWLAALQTVAEKEPELLQEIAERAGLELPEKQRLTPLQKEGDAFAEAYGKILAQTPAEKGLSGKIRDAVIRDLPVYEASLAELLQPYNKGL